MDSMRVTGENEAVRKLRQIEPATQRRARPVIRQAALNVTEGAKRRVDVKTGKGRESIHPEFSTDGLRAVVTHTPETFYLRFLEDGTVNMEPRPWLFPAWEEEQPRYESEMRRALKRLEGGF